MDKKMRENIRNLAETLLNTDDGISENAYQSLLSVLHPDDASAVSTQVDATDGFFYVNDKIDWN